MERTHILDLMRTLKLYGTRSSYDEIMAAGIKRQNEPPRIVGDLLQSEIAEKQARSIRYQMTIAKLPLVKDIEEFDFTSTPINEGLVTELLLALHQRELCRGLRPRALEDRLDGRGKQAIPAGWHIAPHVARALGIRRYKRIDAIGRLGDVEIGNGKACRVDCPAGQNVRCRNGGVVHGVLPRAVAACNCHCGP